MNKNDVDFFETVKSQLQQLYGEISLLSKGKPDNPTNKFKLKFINQKISDANRILTENFVPLKGFTEFSEDDLPTNSDIVLVLSQYLDGLEAWRSANVRVDPIYGTYWNIKDGEIPTEPTSRFRQANKKSK